MKTTLNKGSIYGLSVLEQIFHIGNGINKIQLLEVYKMMLIIVGIMLIFAINQTGFSSDVISFLVNDCFTDNLEFTIIAILFLSYFFIRTVSNNH